MSGHRLDLTPFRIDHRTDAFDFDDHRPDDVAGFDKDDALAATAAIGERLAELQTMLHAQHTHRVLVVIQAMDTGGKDGLIKSLLQPLNPQGVRIAPFKAPTATELAHDFLWRVHEQVPADGELVVFNRSHYEDVLIVRVHGLVPEARWRRRYHHIRAFEELLAEEGTTIVKLFLHISKDEQRERLQARVDDPTKHWKFNVDDLAERTRWHDYQRAYADAIGETAAPHAPWYVVPADRKWFRNLLGAQILLESLERLNLAYPESPDLNGIVVE